MSGERQATSERGFGWTVFENVAVGKGKYFCIVGRLMPLRSYNACRH